jgi:hypothetical protein
LNGVKLTIIMPDSQATRIALCELDRAFREFAEQTQEPARWKEQSSQLCELYASLRLEGDYDVLVARKIRALAELVRSPEVWNLDKLSSALDGLIEEACEAIAAGA